MCCVFSTLPLDVENAVIHTMNLKVSAFVKWDVTLNLKAAYFVGGDAALNAGGVCFSG